ncbi:hypothetical protein NEMBOFW57_009660 [Staphylotrichum longicolle]|uniref:Uncharacterized protein n=1 Tax=Staphylotrichum longicolle TaxID=669026 RepID=A0AAD4EPS3_9PEZI|nr:hypothetical protein NEMBOFW57_009660 [Staphylotrichum longicolle]
MAPSFLQGNPSNPRRDTDSRASARGQTRHVPAQDASSRGPDASTPSHNEPAQGRRHGTNDVVNLNNAHAHNSGGTAATLPPPPAPTPHHPSSPRQPRHHSPTTKPATHLAKTNDGITKVRQMTAKNKHLATTNLDAISKQRAAAQQTAADLAARNRDVEALRGDKSELEKQLQLAREGLDKQLRVLRAEKDGLVDKVGKLGAEKDALKKDKEELTRQVGELKGQNGKLGAEKDALKKDKEELTRQVSELKEQNGKWAEKYDLLVESLDEPGQALVEISQQLIESNNLLEKLLDGALAAA